MRCVGIFSDGIIANILLIQTVNRFENRSIFDEVEAHEVKAYKVCQFFGPSCIQRENYANALEKY